MGSAQGDVSAELQLYTSVSQMSGRAAGLGLAERRCDAAAREGKTDASRTY